MFSKLPFRLIRLVVLGALVVILSGLFIKESKGNYPGIVRQLAYRFGINLPYAKDDLVDYQVSRINLAKQLDQIRENYQVPTLTENETLNQAAEIALNSLMAQAKPQVSKELLDRTYEEVGFDNYIQTTTNFVLGPSLMYATPSSWLTKRILREDLRNKDFNQYGLAIKQKSNNSLLKEWAALLILAQVSEKKLNHKSLKTPTPFRQRGSTKTQSVTLPKPTKKVTRPKSTAITFPNVSDQEVIDALNLYRVDHKIHPLVVDKNLCEYAEKRVQDLLKHGSLDNHAGFKKDFDVDDPDKLPEPIKRYSGGTIAENLAYQYCKNMRTGESFIAQTGTALIEWCFDSSTAGHREAQLNPRYNAVCVRHANGYYVVIFGE